MSPYPPRRRGNPHGRGAPGRRGGPIPAQAGEPRSRAASPSVSRAYPRAGGGTRSSPTATSTLKGLSPRRRGNHLARPELLLRHGPIPAQAGEPRRSRGGRGDTRAYPRAGGGTAYQLGPAGVLEGLSPRRRGNPSPVVVGSEGPGAYPRAGGGTVWRRLYAGGVTGLSPRRRGNHAVVAAHHGAAGPIPAQAGEPPTR